MLVMLMSSVVVAAYLHASAVVAASGVHVASSPWGVTTEILIVALTILFAWVIWIVVSAVLRSRRNR